MFFGTYPGRDPGQTNTYNSYGLNRCRRGSKGEMSDMKNMGTLEYPCAAPRGKRRTVVNYAYNINAAVAPDSTNVDTVTGLTGIMSGAFLYNGAEKSGDNELPSDYSWEIVRLGNLYIINGYKAESGGGSSLMYYYNIDTDKFGVAGDDKIMGDLIVAAGVDENGSYLSTFRYGFPSVYDYSCTNDDGTVTIDNADFFNKYGNPVIDEPNIFEQIFSVGEEVQISGFPSREENFGQLWTYQGSSETVIPQLQQGFEGNNTIDTDLLPTIDDLGKWDITNAYIKGFDITKLDISDYTAYVHKVYLRLLNKYGEEIDFIEMIDDTASVYCSGVTLSRRRRMFDHIAVHNGRLWGSIPTGNRIYISNSNDYFDFTPASVTERFAGRIESDTPGTFKALAEYGSELVAFKEDSISVIYGSGISEYSTSVIPGIGCIDPRSIVSAPSGIIFLSYNGFYIFTGNVPSTISYKLNTKYKSAVCGYDGNIYYASAVREKDGVRELICYDMRHAVWHIQDDLEAVGFFRFRSKFFIAGKNSIYETDADTGDDFEWSFTSVLTHDNTLDDKALNEMWIRAELSEGAEFTVHTCVDGGEVVKHSRFKFPTGLQIYRCPIRAVMGNAYKWTITGKGNVVFYEVELHKAGGGRQRKDPDVTEQVISKKHGRLSTY